MYLLVIILNCLEESHGAHSKMPRDGKNRFCERRELLYFLICKGGVILTWNQLSGVLGWDILTMHWSRYCRTISKIDASGTRYPNAIAEEGTLSVLDIVQFDEGKCVFPSSGSEAVEFGAQMIRRVTVKELLLTFSNSYLSAYGAAGNKKKDVLILIDLPIQPGIRAVLDEIPYEQLGGFVFEQGGSGSGFVKFPPNAFVVEIASPIKQAGGLVMVNEVTTGMGRTGKWFGFQHYDIQPELVALGKGLGNGYPVSAVAIAQNVAQSLESSGVRYAQSHQNDPLGCAVANEVIKIMHEENWIERGAEIGSYFLSGLQSLETKHSIIKEVRGRGMLMGLELLPHSSFSSEVAYRALLEEGFLVVYYPAGNMLRFDPALTIEKQAIDLFLNSLDGILRGVMI
jgi:acetylornithine/N-succinyldiaminopimelate aminotransferase